MNKSKQFLKFCEMFQHLTQEEELWWRKELEIDSNLATACDASLDFEYKFEELRPFGKTLKIWSNNYCDVYYLSKLIQKFLIQMRPNETFVITYAEFSDQPNPGEFGGGIYLISKDQIIHKNIIEYLKHELLLKSS